jgi:hypothetical protein
MTEMLPCSKVGVTVAIRRQARKTVTAVVKSRAESAGGGKRKKHRTRETAEDSKHRKRSKSEDLKTENGLKGKSSHKRDRKGFSSRQV